jgi:hypothetical protein
VGFGVGCGGFGVGYGVGFGDKGLPGKKYSIN